MTRQPSKRIKDTLAQSSLFDCNYHITRHATHTSTSC